MTDSVTITLMILHITVHNLQKVKQNTHLIPICLRYFRIIGFLRRQEKKPAKKRVCHILRTENSIDSSILYNKAKLFCNYTLFRR